MMACRNGLIRVTDLRGESQNTNLGSFRKGAMEISKEVNSRGDTASGQFVGHHTNGQATGKTGSRYYLGKDLEKKDHESIKMGVFMDSLLNHGGADAQQSILESSVPLPQHLEVREDHTITKYDVGLHGRNPLHAYIQFYGPLQGRNLWKNMREGPNEWFVKGKPMGSDYDGRFSSLSSGVSTSRKIAKVDEKKRSSSLLSNHAQGPSARDRHLEKSNKMNQTED